MAPNRKTTEILYDGECPLCAYFAKRVRNKSNNMDIINARKASELKAWVEEQNININKGLVVVDNNKIFSGYQALSLLANRLPTDTIPPLPIHFFRHPKISCLVYPVLKVIRLLLLKIRGKSKINTHR